MTAARRATAGITNAELEAVAHLTLLDAASVLGVGSPATVRLLYKSRGVHRLHRRPGEMAEYKTRATYTKGNGRGTRMTGTIGLYGDEQRVRMFWDPLTEDMGKVLGLRHVCPDLGTAQCLECELGEGQCLDDCDCQCQKCDYEQECPCSLWSWQARQEK